MKLSTPLAQVQTDEDNPIIVVAPAKKKEPKPSTGNSLVKFRQLLQEYSFEPSEEVMNVLIRHFASSVGLVHTPEQAYSLYSEAALLPRSATNVVLSEKGISISDVFRGSDPSRAILLHAQEGAYPKILKVATDESIRHEWNVWSAVKSNSGVSQNSDSYLVDIQLLEFESAEIELGDVSGGSIHHPRTRCGLLMRHYQSTLSQSKIPIPATVLLRYGRFLSEALFEMHRAGYCHLDVKPSNVFLFEGKCFLGDYGAATRTGDPIRERTVKYYPKDAEFEASPETDMYLLVVTLLEMFGAIPRDSERNPMEKQEIRDKIASVQTDEVRIFLDSLIDRYNEPRGDGAT